ncbi:MAG: hypothetical protein QHC90_05160 [Shinella sp.]|nr:hypothetical protein [Shinella sp.]
MKIGSKVGNYLKQFCGQVLKGDDQRNHQFGASDKPSLSLFTRDFQTDIVLAADGNPAAPYPPPPSALIYRTSARGAANVDLLFRAPYLRPVLVRADAPWDFPEANQSEHTLLPQAVKQRQEGKRHVTF